MKGKRGQFYLIAAVVIVSVIIGFGGLNNYARVQENNARVYDLGEELKIETSYVYDYAIYNNGVEIIDDWIAGYVNYSKTQGIENWIFVYGNKSKMFVRAIGKNGKIEVNYGTNVRSIDIRSMEDSLKEEFLFLLDSQISVNFNNNIYRFDIREGENFFFIISSDGYVAKS